MFSNSGIRMPVAKGDRTQHGRRRKDKANGADAAFYRRNRRQALIFVAEPAQNVVTP
jgi:hypothetical protein